MIEKVSNSISSHINLQVNVKESTPKIKEHMTGQHQEPLQQAQSKENIDKVVHSMNDFLSASNTHLKFEFHDDLKEYYVTIVNDVTNEVVKEIPSKKLLDMYAAMTDYLGLLVDKKV